LAEELIRRQEAYHERVQHPKEIKGSQEIPKPQMGFGAYSQVSGNNVIEAVVADGGKKVLTLYGNAPGPKQLFSSLQKPTTGVKSAIVEPLREIGLPNGISTTQIVTPQASETQDDKKAPTLGELFGIPGTTTPFQPPRPSHLISTRSANVGWYQPTVLESPRSKNSLSYSYQTVSTGQWLDYTGASNLVDARRRQRERALSLGGLKYNPVSTVAEQEAKNDALFRSAYSSFAPNRDDAAAIVPTGTLNTIWWQKMGEKCFERLVENAQNLKDAVVPETDDAMDTAADTADEPNLDEEFKNVVDTWDETLVDPGLKDEVDASKSVFEKDVEEVLEEISELLETLNSYQRNRNMTLNPQPRAGATGTAADPTKPTEVETATYNILQSQLALMISMLPPYAVAKLNSDRLSALGISTRIPIVTESHKGIMEEDEAAARAKVAEMRAASAASAARPVPSASTGAVRPPSVYGGQYSAARPSVGGQAGQQYYSPSQTPARAPSTNPIRPPGSAVPGATPYGGPRPVNSTPIRPPSSYATPVYPHQFPPRPASGAPTQYGTPGAPQPYNAASQGYNQQYTGTPATQANRNPQPMTGAIPRPYTPYGPTQPGYGYSGSPQKPPAYGGQPTTNGVTRPPYALSASGAIIPPNAGQRYPYSSVPNGAAAPPSAAAPSTVHPAPAASQSHPIPAPAPAALQPQSQAQSAAPQGTVGLAVGSSGLAQGLAQAATGQLGATGYHTVMTPEQQSTMMERQRAQLAQQQGREQGVARSMAQAGAAMGQAAANAAMGGAPGAPTGTGGQGGATSQPQPPA
jgi:hypothetical protein